MEYFNTFEFNGERFFNIALILIAIYLLLNLADGFLMRNSIFGRWHKKIRNGVHNVFIIYEPVAVLLIAVSLILVSPLFFGLLALIVMMIGLSHLRNYFSGRLVQLDKGIETGQQIKTGDYQGVISQISRFGIRLKTAKGLHFITYPKLLAEGYVLSAGEDLGGFYRLTIAEPNDQKVIDAVRLNDLMASAPYLDWNHDTELAMNYDHQHQVEAKVLVREDHHLQDLIGLINEWGFKCKVSKK